MKSKRYFILITIILLFLSNSLCSESTANSEYRISNIDTHANGELIFFEKDTVVLDTGEIFKTNEKTIFFLNGYAIDNSKIQTGQIVYLKINPENYKVESLESYDNKIKSQTKLKNLEIYTLKILNKKPLRQREYLQVILKGTARKKAYFDIMGLVHNLPLKETSPGVYQGQFRVKEGCDLNYGVLVGFLEYNKEKVSNITAGFQLAATPPEITQTSPAPNSKCALRKPDIFVVIKSIGALIDPVNCNIYINGKEAKRNTQKTVNLILYNPSEDLSYGKNYVKVKIKDRAGNVISKEWSFEVIK